MSKKPQMLRASNEEASAIMDALVTPFLAGLADFVEKNVPPMPGDSTAPYRMRCAAEGEVAYLGVREVVKTLCNRAAADNMGTDFMLNAFFQAGQALGSIMAFQDYDVAQAIAQTVVQGMVEGHVAAQIVQQPVGNA